jgi:hypothetical protein
LAWLRRDADVTLWGLWEARVHVVIDDLVFETIPPSTLEYLAGQGNKLLRNISPDHMKYTTSHVFFELPEEGGVLRMPHFSLDMLIGYT